MKGKLSDSSLTEKGVGFVLFNGFMKWILQGAVIVNTNCSRFKESQLRFSPIEGEAKAL